MLLELSAGAQGWAGHRQRPPVVMRASLLLPVLALAQLGTARTLFRVALFSVALVAACGASWDNNSTPPLCRKRSVSRGSLRLHTPLCVVWSAGAVSPSPGPSSFVVPLSGSLRMGWTLSADLTTVAMNMTASGGWYAALRG